MNKKAIAYLEKVDGLINDIAELEEQKRQGHGNTEEKIKAAKAALSELLDQPIYY